MGEEDLKERHNLQTEDGGSGQKPGSGIGSLLRRERERQGLTCEDVAEATKLRRHFIEALEEENWEALPPPVFVKGFITSYARTLRFNAQEMLDLYERDAPKESAPHRFYAEPKKGKRWQVLLVLILLAAVGFAYYLWKGYPDPKESVVPEKASPLVAKKAKSNVSPRETPAEEMKQQTQPLETKPEPPAPAAEVKDMPGEIQTPAEEGNEQNPPEFTEVQNEPATERLVLRADILGRTWIRICLDDMEPREYVFQPGSRPQWEAEKGFYVIVGNAAGVEFEFNEKRLKDLGTTGQVVRLSLPEGFQSVHCGE